MKYQIYVIVNIRLVRKYYCEFDLRILLVGCFHLRLHDNLLQFLHLSRILCRMIRRR